MRPYDLIITDPIISLMYLVVHDEYIFKKKEFVNSYQYNTVLNL